MSGRDIRRRLHEGERVYATNSQSLSPRWPTILSEAGADFVFVDTEHTPRNRESLSWMCHAYTAAGVPPVVRIPSPDPYEACKVLDGGASGVIAPYVETVEQARALVGAARYRPLKGRRLVEAIDDASSLEPVVREYLESRNCDTIAIVNIESVPAIENLDAILSVPGLDAVLIGPHDLSVSLGIPEKYGDPRFDEAVRAIFDAAREHRVGAGIHFWEGTAQEAEWARAGGNLIMHSSDISVIAQNLRREFDEIRSILGDPPRGAAGEP